MVALKKEKKEIEMKRIGEKEGYKANENRRRTR